MKYLFLLFFLAILPSCSSKKEIEAPVQKTVNISKTEIQETTIDENKVTKDEVIKSETTVEKEKIEDTTNTKKEKVIKTSKPKTVILTWKAPKEKLVRYHIEYGFKKNALINKKTIEVQNLKRINHPKHSELFIYKIKNIPGDKNFYYRLQSENDVGLSKKSSILKVP